MRNLFNKVSLFLVAVAFSLSAVAGMNFPSNAPQSTFSALPTATAVTSFSPYLVTDVGTGGSLWTSNGSTWSPVGGYVNLFQSSIPMGIPPSGSIAATTGVLTLNTSLDQVYPSIYFWMPAGAWTGSTAGMYYATCTTTTSCLIYSNQYAGGVPTIPASPTLVTTGVGAYTQTTGAALTLLSYSMPANLMGPNGKLTTTFLFASSNTSNAKTITPWSIFLSIASSKVSTTIGLSSIVTMTASNMGVTSKQIAPVTPAFVPSYYLVSSTNDTTQSLNIATQGQLSNASDYIIIPSLTHGLTR